MNGISAVWWWWDGGGGGGEGGRRSRGELGNVVVVVLNFFPPLLYRVYRLFFSMALMGLHLIKLNIVDISISSWLLSFKPVHQTDYGRRQFLINKVLISFKLSEVSWFLCDSFSKTVLIKLMFYIYQMNSENDKYRKLLRDKEKLAISREVFFFSGFEMWRILRFEISVSLSLIFQEKIAPFKLYTVDRK